MGEVASSPTLAIDREAEMQRGRERGEPGPATDTKEMAPVPNEDKCPGATVSVGDRPGAEAAEDSLHTSEMHRESGAVTHTARGAHRATQSERHREGYRPPALAGTLADNLVFGASSWLLNTTASVVGVPLRVVPSSTAAAGALSEPTAAKIAVAEKEEATRLALRRMPRAELIKELQVLERRVAALKSALREQPAAPRPPSERW